MKTLETILRRFFFYGSFVLATVAIFEKIANLFHYTILRGYAPRQLLEYAMIGLLFAISMQLHQIRLSLGGQSGDMPK